MECGPFQSQRDLSRSTTDRAPSPRPLQPLQSYQDDEHRQRHPTPREVALGALRALRKIEAVVQGDRDAVHQRDTREQLEKTLPRGGVHVV